MEMNRAQDSVEILSGLIERNPKVGYFHAQLGAALQQLEKLEEAQQAVSRALELDPEDGLALGMQSRILAELGLFSEAIPGATKATAILNEAWVFDALGWAYENDGFGWGKEALTAYQAAIEVDPNDLWSVTHKGNALRLIGRKREAREVYQQVIDSARTRTAESGGYTASLLGWCHYNLGEYDEAIRLYLTLTTTTASIASEQYDLALALLCAGRCTLALETYRKATEGLRSKYIGKQRGVIHVALFDLYEALSDPDVTKADSALIEVMESFHLLLQRFQEVGGTEKITLPALKVPAY